MQWQGEMQGNLLLQSSSSRLVSITSTFLSLGEQQCVPQDQGDRESDGKLSGTCTCDKGYNGTLCDTCKKKFIRVDDNCEGDNLK